ncbi:MAG TPA: T9SS type A sorting domain-containing protein, partial [Candidatus Marinimicrobia bacterium]|nr:T9SS type A sorting domain-containing protein [Candidatus Neomarinimicrobiota bacterium]
LGVDDIVVLPEVFALRQNYPNPFNPVTTIAYDIPEIANVRIDMYNILGQKVRTLVNGTHQPGVYHVRWNGTNDFGNPLSSGMYFYRISSEQFISVKKLVLMK